MSVAIHTTRKSRPRNRVELDERLKGEGLHAPLFKSEENIDKARWILKQQRAGKYDKTVNFERP